MTHSGRFPASWRRPSPSGQAYSEATSETANAPAVSSTIEVANYGLSGDSGLVAESPNVDGAKRLHSIAWWPSLVVLVIASGIDLRTRRIPNWLVLPFLVAGLAVQSATAGFPGAMQSLAGIALATLLFGVPCFLRGMGMGDLKLAAGVGAWIGPSQLFMAFVVTGIVGGIFAVAYALWRGRLGESLDGVGDLFSHFMKSGARPHDQIRLEDRRSIAIPYAPAIAIGTLFSFFTR